MDIAYQGHKFKIKSKKMTGVKEYPRLVGWFLSLFNVAFKTLDSRGNPLYINRESFCLWLLDQENERRIEGVTQLAFKDLSQVVKVFQGEFHKLSKAMGGHTPDLHSLYDVMRDELQR